MSYVKKQTSINNDNILEIYYTKKLPVKNNIRSPKMGLTPLAQEEVNNKNAINMLRLLILNNFGDRDLFLSLTYKDKKDDDRKEPTPEEAKKHLANFRQKLIRFYKKKNAVVKYIFCTECTSKQQRIHHHLLLKVEGCDVNPTDIKNLWGHGFVSVKVYGGQITDAEDLANYMVKKKRNAFFTAPGVFKKRYNASKNLEKPQVTSVIVRRKYWLREPRIPKGYMLDKNSLINGIYTFGNGESDYEYQFYRLIKIDKPARRINLQEKVKAKRVKKEIYFTHNLNKIDFLIKYKKPRAESNTS